jgi:hypothetical protein
MKASIIIALDIEGFHHYPNAPEEVNFLSHRHRHQFKIKIGFFVSDLNRELEFFLLREFIEKRIHGEFGYPAEFGARSCEMIANWIIGDLQDHEFNLSFVEVWEEEIAGARIDL